MKHELIDRYIYAVTRHLPPKLRADVEKELASLIADMLEARCGEVLPTEKDIRVVLTELGAPEELAAKYSGDEGKALISGSYFLIYKLVLKIVLPIAAVGIAFAGVLSLFAEGPQTQNPYMLIGKTIAGMFGGAIGGTLQAFAIITFIFAVFEWKKVRLGNGDFLASLPQVPKPNLRIKPYEPVIGMAWSVLAAVVFLGFPQVAGAWLEGAGWIPVFDTQVLRSFWLPIVLWAVLGIAKEIVKLIDGSYTPRVAIVTTGANLLIAAGAVMVFRQSQIMNPAFVQNIDKLLVGEGGRLISGLFEKFNLLLLGIVLFALVLETITTLVKARKHGR